MQTDGTTHRGHFLRIKLYPHIYQRYEIVKDLSIGRDENNDISLNDASVSSHHAMVIKEQDKVWIEDLGSTNGTLVNEIIVHKRALQEGDVIHIGYTNIVFSSEIEKTCPCVVDLVKERSFEKEKIVHQNDLSFVFPSDEKQISNVLVVFEEQLVARGMSSVARKNFGMCVKEALENAHVHGNGKNAENSISCRFFYEKDAVKVTIGDNGEGFPARDWFVNNLSRQDFSGKGIFTLIKHADEIEYNAKGNRVVLVKKFEPSTVIREQQTRRVNLLEKHLAIRYPARTQEKNWFPLDVVFTSEALKIFPENILHAIKAKNESEDALLVDVMPVCPGCICAPISQKADLFQTPTKIRFWVTPLVSAKMDDASLLVMQEGNLVKSLGIPFQSSSGTLPRFLFALAFLVPFVCIAADIPQWNVKEELPAIVHNLCVLVTSLGGMTLCGLFAGLFTLGFGIITYLRARTSTFKTIYDVIQF